MCGSVQHLKRLHRHHHHRHLAAKRHHLLVVAELRHPGPKAPRNLAVPRAAATSRAKAEPPTNTATLAGYNAAITRHYTRCCMHLYILLAQLTLQLVPRFKATFKWNM